MGLALLPRARAAGDLVLEEGVKRALPYLLYGVVTLVCFYKFLLFGWTLYDVRTLEGYLGAPQAPSAAGWFESHRPPVDRGDTVLSLPMLHRLYGEGLHHGELRLWNPFLFCGYPIYNNLLLHPFYPPNLLLHAALPPRAAYDLNLLIHFFFSGAAMFWLLRGCGRSDFAAWVGGLLWMLIGYNTFWFSTGTFMGASVFAPLALLGLRRGLESKTFRPLALGGLAMGMVILGSHGQHALHVLIFFSIWMLVCWIADRDSRRFILKGGGIFIAATLGTGMAAILTQLDSVTNGFRVPGDDLQLHYRDPWMLPTYIANLALGKVCYAPDGLLRSEFTIYAGVAGTSLALVGAILGFRDRWLRYLTIFAMIALCVAFLKPVALLALKIPLLNLSMPARWVYAFGLCVTLLAAAGVDALTVDVHRGLKIVGSVVVASVALLALHTKQGAVLETLIGCVLATAWILAAWKKLKIAPALCVAALAFDLIPSFVCFNSHADPAILHRTFPVVEALRTRQKEPFRMMGILRAPEAPAKGFDAWSFGIGANILALYGLEAVMGYESIAPVRTVEYCLAAKGDVYGAGRLLLLFDPGERMPAIANMQYFAVPFNLGQPIPFEVLGKWGELWTYRERNTVPRACLTRHVEHADAERIAVLLGNQDADPRTTLYLETPSLPPVRSGEGTVSWISRETDRIELAVDAKDDTVLFVSDTDYPGWEAEVDGVGTPILRADITFRAVAVPAGAHRVVMRFRPASARNGLILSALSIVGILAYCGRKKTV
jgi:hypothetical protein